MKRPPDDDLTTRALPVIFYRLGGSGQIHAYRFRRLQVPIMYLVAGCCVGVLTWAGIGLALYLWAR